MAYVCSQARGPIRTTPQPQPCGIWATSATYIRAPGNTRSLTHWARPGIKPTSSWILVGFVTTEARWELLFCFFQTLHHNHSCIKTFFKNFSLITYTKMYVVTMCIYLLTSKKPATKYLTLSGTKITHAVQKKEREREREREKEKKKELNFIFLK